MPEIIRNGLLKSGQAETIAKSMRYCVLLILLLWLCHASYYSKIITIDQIITKEIINTCLLLDERSKIINESILLENGVKCLDRQAFTWWFLQLQKALMDHIKVSIPKEGALLHVENPNQILNGNVASVL